MRICVTDLMCNSEIALAGQEGSSGSPATVASLLLAAGDGRSRAGKKQYAGKLFEITESTRWRWPILKG